MQIHKFRTSPTLDKIDTDFYCIKGTQYLEDSRMVRIIEWFRKGEGLTRVDLHCPEVKGSHRCNGVEWKNGTLDVGFTPSKEAVENVPYKGFCNREVSIYSDLFYWLKVPAKTGMLSYFGMEFNGYDFTAPCGFELAECYNSIYHERNDLRRVACVSAIVDEVGVCASLPFCCADHSTHPLPDDYNKHNAAFIEIDGHEVEIYEELIPHVETFTFIRTMTPCDADTFERIVTAVKLASGVLNERYINESTYYFALNENSGIVGFKFKHGLDSIVGWGDWHVDFSVDGLNSRDRLSVFSTYLSRNLKLYDTILLIIKAIHLRGFAKGCMASVMLENITKLLCGHEDEQMGSIIEDETLRRNVKKSLQKTLSEFKHEIPNNIMYKLSSKIGAIDQQTNAGKLSNPFEKYGISISDIDKKCIECRNAFLHGVYPKHTIDEYADKSQEDYADVVGTQILALTVKLIIMEAMKTCS